MRPRQLSSSSLVSSASSGSPTSESVSRPFGAWRPVLGSGGAFPDCQRLGSRSSTLSDGKLLSVPGASLSPESVVTPALAPHSAALKAKKSVAVPPNAGRRITPSSSPASVTRRSEGQLGGAGRKRSALTLPTTSPLRRRRSRAMRSSMKDLVDAEEDAGDEEPVVAKRPAAALATVPTMSRAPLASPAKATPVRPGRRSTTAKATAARRARQLARAIRAEKRHRVASSAVPSAPIALTVAEEFSVSLEQMATHNAEAVEFLNWLKLSSLADSAGLKDEAVLDAMTVKYVATLFDEGMSYATAAAVVYGRMFKFGLPKSRTVLPRSCRALLGFRNDGPKVSRGHGSEEAAVLRVDDLLRQDFQPQGPCQWPNDPVWGQCAVCSRPWPRCAYYHCGWCTEKYLCRTCWYEHRAVCRGPRTPAHIAC